MDAIAVPASQIVQEWMAEIRVRASLTMPELAARQHHQRRAREREISNAIGRPYRIEEWEVYRPGVTAAVATPQQAGNKRRGGY